MSLAQEATTGAVPPNLRANIAAVTRMLLAQRGLIQKDLMPILSLDEGSVSKLMHGRREWTATYIDLMSKVLVYASGNEIVFRLPHGEATAFRTKLMDLILAKDAPAPPPPVVAPAAVSVADEVRKLAQLRDEGLLSDEEFAAHKARLLG